jgi:hypothetical protein
VRSALLSAPATPRWVGVKHGAAGACVPAWSSVPVCTGGPLFLSRQGIKMTSRPDAHGRRQARNGRAARYTSSACVSGKRTGCGRAGAASRPQSCARSKRVPAIALSCPRLAVPMRARQAKSPRSVRLSLCRSPHAGAGNPPVRVANVEALAGTHARVANAMVPSRLVGRHLWPGCARDKRDGSIPVPAQTRVVPICARQTLHQPGRRPRQRRPLYGGAGNASSAMRRWTHFSLPPREIQPAATKEARSRPVLPHGREAQHTCNPSGLARSHAPAPAGNTSWPSASEACSTSCPRAGGSQPTPAIDPARLRVVDNFDPGCRGSSLFSVLLSARRRMRRRERAGAGARSSVGQQEVALASHARGETSVRHRQARRDPGPLVPQSRLRPGAKAERSYSKRRSWTRHCASPRRQSAPARAQGYDRRRAPH